MSAHSRPTGEPVLGSPFLRFNPCFVNLGLTWGQPPRLSGTDKNGITGLGDTITG